MDIAVILNLLFGSTTIVSIIIAWNSRKAQVLITESTAIQELQKAYKEFVIDQRSEVAELKDEVARVRKELKDYQDKCKLCK